MGRFTLLSAIMATCLSTSLGWGQTSTDQEVIRVALVAYEDFHAEYQFFEDLLADFSRQDPGLQFKLTVGSYGEVLHWLDGQRVDIAVLTPGVFASLLPTDNDQSFDSCQYLATVQLPAATSKWSSQQRRVADFHDSYRSVCLVQESSTLQDLADIREALNENQAELLMVHPLSLSGRVAPMEALRLSGIQPSREQIRFTYSHSQSIRMLNESSDTTQRIAFVWDDAAGNDAQLETGVRQLAFPELNRLEIPHDVVVARCGFPHADRIEKLLLDSDLSGHRYRFKRLLDWKTRYAPLRTWLDTVGVGSRIRHGESHSLDEIAHLMLLHSQSQTRPPRLAVVLSGGGAKCSYQVGAVTALEQRLGKLRDENPDHPIDIELVVGTSGGAINSLPIALGISSTSSGQSMLREIWQELDQREIVSPSFMVCLNMGIWFAIVQVVVALFFLRRWVADPESRRRWFSRMCLILFFIEILAGYFPGTPWRWLGTNHLLHHAWLWLSFGIRVSGWTLILLVLGEWFSRIAKTRWQWNFCLPRPMVQAVFFTGLLGLPLLQLVTILFFQQTLSTGQGMEQTLSDKIPRLINNHLEQLSLPSLNLDPTADPADRLQTASRELLKRRLLKRDLVITGSCLEQTSLDIPSDLYFYASSASSKAKAGFGERGISLEEHPRVLLDVILGSGSIFPVFPARKITGIPAAGEQIELVDGGFAHNSPVEAAILWGATHIVLIEATPRSPSQRGSFFKNLTFAFRHLHQQAQLLDARSRGKVTIFSLSPKSPHICVLDFADNLIEAGIERGYQDASQKMTSQDVRFRRELGEPIFNDVSLRVRDDVPN